MWVESLHPASLRRQLTSPQTTEGGNDHKDRNTRDLQWALSSGVLADGRDGIDDQGDDDNGQATMTAIVVAVNCHNDEVMRMVLMLVLIMR